MSFRIAIFVVMDELIKFFKTATLPTGPVKVGAFISVTDPAVFIESCRRRYENGDEEGFVLLEQYKAAIYEPNEKSTPDQSGIDDLSGQ